MAFIQKGVTLLLSVVLLKLLLPVVKAQAPPGLSAVIGDKQYYISNLLPVNWYRAAQTCAALGMTLTSIDTAAEQKNIYNFLNTNDIVNKGYWLSGINLASTAKTKPYTWLATGRQPSYTNWVSEPGTKSCVSTQTTDTTLQWITADCTDEHYYICSKPLLPACGANGKCYYTYSYFIN